MQRETALPHEAPGVPDDRFIRSSVPMTKSEVRALVMAKAHLHPGARVLDIGGGSGSLSIEACLLCPQGEVVTIERDEAALALVRANLDHFGLADVRVVAGEAPEAWEGLGLFDRVFIGGSGGRLGDILDLLPSILAPGGRVVCPCACVETLSCAISRLRKDPWQGFECMHISIARGVPAGRQLRFEALNPVWIVAADVVSEAGAVKASRQKPSLGESQ